MRQTVINYCNTILEFGIYAIFFFVPLVLTSDTSELFELNKMWLTWGLTILIGAAWFSKMIAEKKMAIKRTPLDIPLGLFLLSQIISTVHSLDSHVSLWGYYSRFNGGLFSTFTYIFLYYAIVSNFSHEGSQFIKRLIKVVLFSGLLVCLWGLPSHFGKDPTCLVFRGTLDVDCWTLDFHPTIRLFSTLGQPDWLSAYLCVLLPISVVMFLRNAALGFAAKKDLVLGKFSYSKKYAFLSIYYFLMSFLFFLDLLYSNAKSGFLGFAASFLLFVLFYSFLHKKILVKTLLFTLLVFGLITFFVGTPFVQLNKFTVLGLPSPAVQSKQAPNKQTATTAQNTPAPAAGELGGTDSGKIRLFVWQGALDAWRANPLFGTGVETFAYAYYQFRPPGHNLTSEWNFLYNKAHNEYLNYLATTGAFGLGSYLLLILWFFSLLVKFFFKELRIKRELSANQITANDLTLALLAGFISILVTNFFGFSVVIVNLFFFVIPALVFLRNNMLPEKNFFGIRASEKKSTNVNGAQWTGIIVLICVALYMLFILFRYWEADKSYALGYNLDHANDYVKGRENLKDAIDKRDSEPVFKDELVVADTVLASAFANQKDATTAGQLAKEALDTSNQVVQEHPNNLVFWKSRVRLFYTLAQYDNRYMPLAIQAIEKAYSLAPNDASIHYNLGVIYGQSGNYEKALKALEETITLKPDYRDAYYAAALMYHQLGVDDKGKVIDKGNLEKALAKLEYILKNLTPNDTQSKKQLDLWSNELSPTPTPVPVMKKGK